VDKISVNPPGELVLNLGDGEIRQPKPVIYQMADGARQEISGGYKLVDAHTVGFAVGGYDRSLPLVIDPILSLLDLFRRQRAMTRPGRWRWTRTVLFTSPKSGPGGSP
jgi:hypothetical protein